MKMAKTFKTTLLLVLLLAVSSCTIKIKDTSKQDKNQTNTTQEKTGECVRELEYKKKGYSSIPLTAQGIIEGTAIETSNLSRDCVDDWVEEMRTGVKSHFCENFYKEQNIKRKKICLPPYPAAKPLELQSNYSKVSKGKSIKLTTHGGGGYGEIKIIKDSGDCTVNGMLVFSKNKTSCTLRAIQSPDEFYNETKSDPIKISFD